MDRRIPLAVSSAAGLVLGGLVMMSSVPDTSGSTDTLPPMSSAPASAALAEAPAQLEAAPAAEPNPFAAEAAPANPFGAAAPSGEDPFAALGTAGGWGAVPADAPVAAPAADPVPEPIGSKGAAQIGGSPTVTGSLAGLPADVRGVSQAMKQLDAPIKVCMDRDAPAKMSGEATVMVQVRIETQGEVGKVTGVTAPQDTESRYTAFLACLASTMASVEFRAPSGGTADINWALNR